MYYENAFIKVVCDIDQLWEVFIDFYGHKAHQIEVEAETKTISCVLYDTFYVSCSIGDRYGQFCIAVWINNMGTMTDYLGKTYSLNNDVESIRESLGFVDFYCKTSLPDKYLEAYDLAYK